MTGPIALLTGPMAAPFLRDYLVARNPERAVHITMTLGELEDIVATAPDLRLIAFLTNVIVPRRVLSRLGPEPYNIHPGPPEFPGVHPEAFAIWERAESFGVTAHVIHPRVDSGPIVFTERFEMPHLVERRALADLAFLSAINAFRHVADHCAVSDASLPRTDAGWTGMLRTRRAFTRLCERSPRRGESRRLARACGEDLGAPDHRSPMTF